MEVLNEILFVKSLVVCIALGKYLQSSEVGEFSTGVLSVRALGSVPSIRKKKSQFSPLPSLVFCYQRFVAYYFNLFVFHDIKLLCHASFYTS